MASQFPTLQLPVSDYGRYYKGRLDRLTTILVYEYTYMVHDQVVARKSGKVTQRDHLHAEIRMLVLLGAEKHRIRSLTMWINNSPCGDCADGLEYLMLRNEGIKLTIYCVYKYSGRGAGDEASEGLKKLMKAGVEISSIPRGDRYHILDQSRMFCWEQMEKDASEFEETMEGLRQVIEDGAELTGAFGRLRDERCLLTVGTCRCGPSSI